MDEHKRCMLAEAPCGFPPTLLEQMSRPKLDRIEQGVIFSPSSIGACHRQHSLQKDHDWYVSPEDSYSMTRGTLMHKWLAGEPAPDGTLGVIRELRMHAPIEVPGKGRQKFSGQVDEILLLRLERDAEDVVTLHVSITDWKSRSDIPHSMIAPDKKHEYQVNYYSWLTTEVLALYISEWEIRANKEASFQLTGDPLPEIDLVVVDEINVVYMSMSKVRKFTSSGFRFARGKQLGEIGNDGHWHRYKNPERWEEIELAPVRVLGHEYVESLIRQGIALQIDGDEQLAPPLIGEDAALMCPKCGVREACINLGLAQGYDMKDQGEFKK
jgi:hypothetical protein